MTPEESKIIAENIRTIRLQKGLTQEEVAGGLCSVSQFSKIENGKSPLKPELVKKIASRLGVSVEQLQTADQEQQELRDTLEMSHNAVMARQYDLALEYARSVVRASKQRGDQELYELAIKQEIQALTLPFRYTEVIERLEHLLFVERVAFSTIFETILYLELGRAHAMTGNRDKSYSYFLRGEASYQQLTDLDPDSVDALRMNYLLTRGCLYMRSYHAGLRYAREAIRLAQLNDLPVSVVESQICYGVNLIFVEGIDHAEPLFLQVLNDAQNLQLVFLVAALQDNLATICQTRGEYGRAQFWFHRALKNFELAGGWEGQSDCLLNLAEIALEEQDHQTMLQLTKRATRVLDAHQPHGYMYRAYMHVLLSRLRLSQGDREEAVQELKRALHIYDTHHVFSEAYKVTVKLGDLFYEQGDAQAVEFYRQAIRYDQRNVSLK